MAQQNLRARQLETQLKAVQSERDMLKFFLISVLDLMDLDGPPDDDGEYDTKDEMDNIMSDICQMTWLSPGDSPVVNLGNFWTELIEERRLKKEELQKRGKDILRTMSTEDLEALKTLGELKSVNLSWQREKTDPVYPDLKADLEDWPKRTRTKSPKSKAKTRK